MKEIIRVSPASKNYFKIISVKPKKMSNKPFSTKQIKSLIQIQKWWKKILSTRIKNKKISTNKNQRTNKSETLSSSIKKNSNENVVKNYLINENCFYSGTIY